MLNSPIHKDTLGAWIMMSDIRMEKVLEAIYEHISEHMPAEACENCGVLKMLGDLMVGMKKENNREIALEMGFDCVDVRCPFISVDSMIKRNGKS